MKQQIPHEGAPIKFPYPWAFCTVFLVAQAFWTLNWLAIALALIFVAGLAYWSGTKLEHVIHTSQEGTDGLKSQIKALGELGKGGK